MLNVLRLVFEVNLRLTNLQISLKLKGNMDMDKSIVFLSSWIVNSVVLLLLSETFQKQIALGNSTIAGAMSAVICALVFTLILYAAPIITAKMELKFKEERIYIVLHAFLLIPFIWIMKKFALFTGLGISNNFIILLVAIMVSLAFFYATKYSTKFLAKLGSS